MPSYLPDYLLHAKQLLADMRFRSIRHMHRVESSLLAKVNSSMFIENILLELPGSARQPACERRRFRHSCARPTATHCCCHCCVSLTGTEVSIIQDMCCSVAELCLDTSSVKCVPMLLSLSAAGAYGQFEGHTCNKRTERNANRHKRIIWGFLRTWQRLQDWRQVHKAHSSFCLLGYSLVGFHSCKGFHLSSNMLMKIVAVPGWWLPAQGSEAHSS